MNLKPETLEEIKTFTNNYDGLVKNYPWFSPFMFRYAQKALTDIYNDLSPTQKERIEKKIKES